MCQTVGQVQSTTLGLFISRVVSIGWRCTVLRPILVCFLQLAMGKMMEQGPVLIVTFQAQVVMVIKNSKGEVYDGDPVSGNQGNGGLGPLLTYRALCIASPAQSQQPREPLPVAPPRAFLVPLSSPSFCTPTKPDPSPCWVFTGQGAANAIRVGTLQRPGRAQPLRCLAPSGHLSLQHRADPLRAAMESRQLEARPSWDRHTETLWHI